MTSSCAVAFAKQHKAFLLYQKLPHWTQVTLENVPMQWLPSKCQDTQEVEHKDIFRWKYFVVCVKKGHILQE